MVDMHIVSIPTIWSCKTPNSGWLNLAQVRQLQRLRDKETQVLGLGITWSNGQKQIFTGEDAQAILTSWQQACNKYQLGEINNAKN